MNFRYRVFYLSGLCVCVFLVVIDLRNTSPPVVTLSVHRKDVIKVLLWPPIMENDPYFGIKNGRESLIEHQCRYKNCIIIRNVSSEKISEFDAIVFNAFDDIKKSLHPMFFRRRNLKQKYIFASLESSLNYPVSFSEFDNFFNWTWTYRLDSDIPWTYFTIHDEKNRVIGPAVNITWLTTMKPVNRSLMERINLKTKSIAWVVSHCKTQNRREVYVSSLDSYLHKYGIKIDRYGRCSNNSIKDLNVIDDYYFYLAFENSMAEDYVTEKIINALDHFTIPVVYGGANYSRFLPPNSYLDASKLTPKVLAKTINENLKNKSVLYDYFKWRNHYTYKFNTVSGVCDLCAALNNRTMMEKVSTIPKFRPWWNGQRKQRLFEVFYDLITALIASDTLLEEFKHINQTKQTKWMLHYYQLLKKENIHNRRIDNSNKKNYKEKMTSIKISTYYYNFTTIDKNEADINSTITVDPNLDYNT